jgi:hypothetical protein
LSAAQSALLLKQLEELETLSKAVSAKKFAGAKDAFTAAMASDKALYDFLLACHRQLDFPNAKETEFRAWRDKQEARFKNAAHLLVVRLQLQYLVLSIHAAESKTKDRAPVMTELANFMGTLAGVADRLGDEADALKKPVTDSVFGKLYQLDGELKGEGWELAPGRITEIYEKVLIPWYRANKPASVIGAWDARIGAAEKMALAGGEKEMEQFTTKQLPSLRWKRAKELYSIGSHNQALPQLFAIIKEHPTHPNAQEWIASLRDLLSGKTEESPGEAAATAAQAVPAAPVAPVAPAGVPQAPAPGGATFTPAPVR